jgi:peptide/nickel transport system permease protein
VSIWRNLPLKAKVGAFLFGFFALVAIFGPIFEPFAPGFENQDPKVSLNPPSLHHLMGTTQVGEDVLSQLLTGTRLTLEVCLLVGIIATVLSVLIGVTAAYLGGIWDEVLSLLTNVFLVLPALPLLIVLLGYLSNQGQTPTIIVLAGLGWPWGARVIRAQTLTIRSRDFIAASRESGEKTWRIIIFEIIPNEISLIVALFVNAVLFALGASVALAFIGIADLTSFSLGVVLYWAESGNALQTGDWWWWIPAGLIIALIGTSLVLLNSGIDEIGNPRLRASRVSGRIAGHRIWTTDPTPVLSQLTANSTRFGQFAHSFSRASLLDPQSAKSLAKHRATNQAKTESQAKTPTGGEIL